jgi:hypothetical protein
LTSPYAFFVSTTEKMLNGQQHENIEGIQAAVMMELTAILKGAFSSCFQATGTIVNIFNFVFFTDSV